MVCYVYRAETILGNFDETFSEKGHFTKRIF
jgi:hypothetical protein